MLSESATAEGAGRRVAVSESAVGVGNRVLPRVIFDPVAIPIEPDRSDGQQSLCDGKILSGAVIACVKLAHAGQKQRVEDGKARALVFRLGRLRQKDSPLIDQGGRCDSVSDEEITCDFIVGL